MTFTPGQLKAAALITAIVLIPLELLLFVVIISILLGDEVDKAQVAFSLVFSMAIFAMPLRWAYLVWKRQKTKAGTPTQVSTVAPDALVTFQTKIELPEYRKLMFALSYSSQVVIYLHIIGMGMFIFYLLNGTGQWFAWFSLLFILYLPIGVYRSASTNYKATKALHETLTYQFTTDAVIITGETFNTSMQWSSFHKVREFKEWFLLYTNKQVAMLIPKRGFASVDEIIVFKEMAGKAG